MATRSQLHRIETEGSDPRIAATFGGSAEIHDVAVLDGHAYAVEATGRVVEHVLHAPAGEGRELAPAQEEGGRWLLTASRGMVVRAGPDLTVILPPGAPP